MPRALRIWIATAVLATVAVAAHAQGPGGAPGMPMQRLGGGRPAAGAGLGTPGMPMARMGRGGGVPQAAPTRRSYGGIAGSPGVMSSQSFRASTMANQMNGGSFQRSSAAMVGGATMGLGSRPASPR